MENMIEFISDFNSLLAVLGSILTNDINGEIFISGSFDSNLYKQIIDEFIRFKRVGSLNMIIPYISKSGIISRPYINKIVSQGGNLRINSKFSKSILIIGDYAFVMSFSYKNIADYGVKSTFESCIVTNDNDTVNRIKGEFKDTWDRSLAIMN